MSQSTQLKKPSDSDSQAKKPGTLVEDQGPDTEDVFFGAPPDDEKPPSPSPEPPKKVAQARVKSFDFATISSDVETLTKEHLTSDRPDLTYGVAQSVEVIHKFNTLNRAIEAVYGTDIVHILGRFPAKKLAKPVKSVHTRRFEPLGDYLPNLAYSDNEDTFFITPKWRRAAFAPSSAELSASNAPVKEDWTRYRSLPGKDVDVYTKYVKPPPFIHWTSSPLFFGMSVYLVRKDIQVSDIREGSEELSGPLLPAALIDLAIKRAGEKEPALVYHTLPTDTELGDSKLAHDWLATKREKRNISLAGAVDSYKEACCQLRDSLRASQLVDSEAEPLKSVLELISSLTEEQSKTVYEQIREAFPSFVEPEEEKVFWFDETTDNADFEDTRFIEASISGTPHIIPANCHERLEIPPPMYGEPENASGNLRECMRAAPILINRGVQVYRASISFTADYLAPSVTPRKVDDERGLGREGILWYEKMITHFSYHGMILFAPDHATEKMRKWTASINTAILQNFLEFGPCCPSPVVRIAFTPPPFPLAAPPTYIDGLGLLDDSLQVSPYIQNLDVWRATGRADCRALLPSKECLKVLSDTRFAFKNANEFLRGTGPLVLAITWNGQSKELVVGPSLQINLEAVDIDEVATLGKRGNSTLTFSNPKKEMKKETAVATPFRELVDVAGDPDQDPSGINPLSTVADSDAWGIPRERTANGWLLKDPNVPKFADVIVRSDNTTLAPTWSNAFRQCKQKNGVTEKMCRELYTVCYLAANLSDDYDPHPVVEYVNPNLVNALINKRLDKAWWSFPTSRMSVHPFFLADDEGRLALSEEAAKAKLKSDKKKAANREHAERNYYAAQSSFAPVSAPNYRGRGGGSGVGRGRGQRSRTSPAPLVGVEGGRPLVNHPALQPTWTVPAPSSQSDDVQMDMPRGTRGSW